MAVADLSATRLVFFGTAATVLPVFMLAISLQFRVRRVFGRGIGLRLESSAQRGIALLIAYTMVVLMAVGEITAIGALYYDSNRGDKSAYVLAALAIGTLLVFIGTVDGVVSQMRDDDRGTGDSPAKAESSAVGSPHEIGTDSDATPP